jgi:hypothetical protein
MCAEFSPISERSSFSFLRTSFFTPFLQTINDSITQLGAIGFHYNLVQENGRTRFMKARQPPAHFSQLESFTSSAIAFVLRLKFETTEPLILLGPRNSQNLPDLKRGRSRAWREVVTVRRRASPKRTLLGNR